MYGKHMGEGGGCTMQIVAASAQARNDFTPYVAEDISTATYHVMQLHTSGSVFSNSLIVKRQKSTSPGTCTLACRHNVPNMSHSLQ